MLDRKNADGSWETFQAEEYPRAMSAGIAAAMVREACKYQSVTTQVDPDEAMEQFAAFSSQLLHTLEAFGDDFDGVWRKNW